METKDRSELEKWIELAWERAREYGLDPYPTHFELVPEHVIYELGSYGLPARFSHWTFGRDYQRQKTSYEYGLSKIYEIVFNTDPTQAFLMESNSMLSHKLVVAHVLGHSDFFRRNSYFAHTDRGMIENVRLHARRLHQYEQDHGERAVEQTLDAAMSIEMNLDASTTRERPAVREGERPATSPGAERRSEYDDIWHIDGSSTAVPEHGHKLPLEPEQDLLRFIRDHGPDLEDWQRDVLNIVREEMIYFIPQMRTKIMNEGWASLWHERILTDMPLTDEEHWEFRRMHSSVLSPGSRMQMNPYYVGYQMLKSIERRWNGDQDPDEPETDWRGEQISRTSGEGLKKIFEVAEQECDVTFLRKYLDQKLVNDLDLYTYSMEEQNGELVWVVKDTDWRHVRDILVDSMTNMGVPVVKVEDGNYKRHGELYLKHYFDGRALDAEYTRRTLAAVYKLWQRPVHVETMAGESLELWTWDGEELTRQPLSGPG